MNLRKFLQRFLLISGIIALIILLVEIGLAVAATMHGSDPVRVVKTNAGPYPLTVNFYKYPANAGFALPFSISTPASSGTVTYRVSSVPGQGVSATPVHATLTNGGQTAQGSAEIPVQGPWTLEITANGPAGTAVTQIPIEATAPPAVPGWFGWLIGLIPIYGLLIFLLLLSGQKKASTPSKQPAEQNLSGKVESTSQS